DKADLQSQFSLAYAQGRGVRGGILCPERGSRLRQRRDRYDRPRTRNKEGDDLYSTRLASQVLLGRGTRRSLALRSRCESLPRSHPDRPPGPARTGGGQGAERRPGLDSAQRGSTRTAALRLLALASRRRADVEHLYDPRTDLTGQLV